MIEFIKIFLSSLLFGVSVASIPPYPNEYDYIILSFASSIFFTVAFFKRKGSHRNKLCILGGMMFICFSFVSLWYSRTDFWYPPQVPIIEQFFFTDGEAGMDAEISNLILMFWFLLVFFMYGTPAIYKKRRKQL